MGHARVIVRAKKISSTKIRCVVNGKFAEVLTSRNVIDDADAIKVVASSYGPFAKNLTISIVSIERSY